MKKIAESFYVGVKSGLLKHLSATACAVNFSLEQTSASKVGMREQILDKSVF